MKIYSFLEADYRIPVYSSVFDIAFEQIPEPTSSLLVVTAVILACNLSAGF